MHMADYCKCDEQFGNCASNWADMIAAADGSTDTTVVGMRKKMQTAYRNLQFLPSTAQYMWPIVPG